MGFLALSMEPDAAEVRDAVLELGLEGTVAITTDEVLAPFGARGVPATAFVTRDGRVVGSATGARDRSFFSRRAQALLEGSR
ncbi:MAG: hypothetical protein QM765_00360 [Myxococcales bacterium]